MGKISAKTLPKGWYWLERSNHHPSQKSEMDSANLYSPYDCHAGEVCKMPHATFYSHTWDEDGTGGENSSHVTFESAKAFVEAAILRQKFHMKCEYNCSDNGCVEAAAERLGECWSLIDSGSQEVMIEVMELALGPKAYREWLGEWEIEEF